jgi:hypothetical protein
MVEVELLGILHGIEKYVDIYEGVVSKGVDVELDSGDCKILLVTVQNLVSSCPEEMSDLEKTTYNDLRYRLRELLFPMFGSHRSFVQEKYLEYAQRTEIGEDLSPAENNAYELFEYYAEILEA